MVPFKFLLLAFTLDVTVITSGLNPCTEYISIDESKRSTSFEVPSPYTNLLCDRNTYNGWYRFTSGAGGELTTRTNLPLYRCGTHIPLYLNGTHPSVGEGIVDRFVCGDYLNQVCYKSYGIQILNCTSYYVYYLVRTAGCSEAYCAGTERECNKGFVSPNMNFTPGCTDMDECSTGIDGCDHRCFNTEGSYYCECNENYKLDTDGKSCREPFSESVAVRISPIQILPILVLLPNLISP
ncbi:oncoprotein-induced transcript 3 protein-like [Glandiceps talaboti]